MVNIKMNNAVESQNETFTHTYLKKHQGSLLTGMVSILIEEQFNDSIIQRFSATKAHLEPTQTSKISFL